MAIGSPEDRIATSFDDVQGVMLNLVTSPLVHLVLIYDSEAMKVPITEMMDSFANKRKGYL